MENKQKLALAICDFLNSSIADKTISGEDAEGIQVAVQCIGEAFHVDIEDASVQEKFSIKPANLATIFNVFLNTQKKVKEQPTETTISVKEKAEELKAKGNKEMAAKNYSQAIEFYTQAIDVVENPIYYGNRAAAFSQLGDHEKALMDAKKALNLDSQYHKAHSRMGHAYFCLGKYQEAVDAYKTAIASDPNNTTLKNSLAAAEQKLGSLSVQEKTSEAPTTGGLPNMGGMDFASLLNNPAMMQMGNFLHFSFLASQMMSNPAFSSMLENPQVAQMAQNLMKDPSALQGLMNNPDLMSQMADKLKK